MSININIELTASKIAGYIVLALAGWMLAIGQFAVGTELILYSSALIGTKTVVGALRNNAEPK